MNCLDIHIILASHRYLIEAGGNMTLLAIASKTTSVNIVMSMTGNAVAWEL